ncbi:DUF7116 family protein [Halopenitus persicus]|uniref:Uncharacterized protein n=1 Tax=Halopenitus persicus TaxID=1048396 RepID=A0A1H3EJC9_9EURY|nr:hypothetical protein [Halopenitus persicus]QHS17563.1 hypothetical protein GWK26_10630 [haloarchaeon 3A1-DGR]SDX78029.1 hypothetical protein SAMN05216564_101442 [Halopenitus persicus]
MAPVSMPPTTEARAVFRELGYTVDGDGSEFVAERKWRRVLVTPVCADDATDPEPYLADGGETPRLRCFVTWRRAATDLRDHLLRLKPPFDWAVIGVDDEGEFDVMQGRPGSP